MVRGKTKTKGSAAGSKNKEQQVVSKTLYNYKEGCGKSILTHDKKSASVHLFPNMLTLKEIGDLGMLEGEALADYINLYCRSEEKKPEPSPSNEPEAHTVIFTEQNLQETPAPAGVEMTGMLF
ncbi:MAG: hypothetical protein DDT23_00821 [candidate division WS2 bacterium]|nr:hypothetical protein [Candidatus Lithacetigena glycinireducens]